MTTLKNKMTVEQMNSPRQFVDLIEANTNFYMHTGDGGNACFSSNCDTIERVWLDGTEAGDTSVTVSVPNNNNILSLDLNRVQSGDTDYIIEFYKPLISIKCENVEDIIEAFKTIEKALIK